MLNFYVLFVIEIIYSMYLYLEYEIKDGIYVTNQAGVGGGVKGQDHTNNEQTQSVDDII